jgi:hypothetical protein
MNTILLGAASLGALLVSLTRSPDQLVLGNEARFAADDAEVARLMEEAPDMGEFGFVVITDPETGEESEATVLAFRD